METLKPKISVVIPVKNGIKYLPEALNSVYAQDYENIEIVVSDDMSTDGSHEYLLEEAKLRNNLRVIRPPHPMKIDEHWTFVCQNSTGDYVKLLCSDDVLFPNAISSQLRILERYPSAGMISTKRNIIGASGVIFLRNRGMGRLSGLQKGFFAVQECVHAGTNIFGEPGSILFRKSALFETLPWNANQPYMLDIEFYFRVLKNWDIYCSKYTEGSFRVHSQSLTSQVHTKHATQFMNLVRVLMAEGAIKISARQKIFLLFRVHILTILRSVIISTILIDNRFRPKINHKVSNFYGNFMG